jgi:uncharacterized protein involved in exopolysaccharide biosynthesis
MDIQEILGYLKVVRKWWWVIALLFAATVGTMLAIALMTKSVYEATVTVLVSAPPPQEAPLFSGYDEESESAEIEQTRAGFSELLLEGEVPYLAIEALPDIPMEEEELRDKITIDLLENSQLMRIHVHASEPETAALLANTLVQTGLERYGQLLALSTANTRQFIQGEMEVAREDLVAAEFELAQFNVINRVGDLDTAIENQYELIRSLKLQRDIVWANDKVGQAQLLDQAIQEREVEMQNLIGLSAEHVELADRVARARGSYNYLMDKMYEAQIKENQILQLSYIQIITPARPPKKPVPAINYKLLVIGTVVSILVGVLLTFLLEYLTVLGSSRGSQGRPERPEVETLSGKAG